MLYTYTFTLVRCQVCADEVKALRVGLVIYYCIRFRTCSGPFIAVLLFVQKTMLIATRVDCSRVNTCIMLATHSSLISDGGYFMELFIMSLCSFVIIVLIKSAGNNLFSSLNEIKRSETFRHYASDYIYTFATNFC